MNVRKGQRYISVFCDLIGKKVLFAMPGKDKRGEWHGLYHDKKIIKKEGAQTVHVDMGYRGHGYAGPETVIVDKRRRGETAKRLWRWMKRRAAVEPTIGHLKQERRLERNQLRGLIGDRISTLLCAAAMNFGKLMSFLLAIFRYLPSRFLPEQAQLCVA